MFVGVCIVRDPGGELKLYCKGADIVILERLQKNQPLQEDTESALEVKSTYEECATLSLHPFDCVVLPGICLAALRSELLEDSLRGSTPCTRIPVGRVEPRTQPGQHGGG